MLTDTISQYLQLKQSLKLLNKELKDQLLGNPEYLNFSDDCRASREVLQNCKDGLIKDSPSIGSLADKVSKKKVEIKLLKEAIGQACKVVDSETGETIGQLSFKF